MRATGNEAVFEQLNQSGVELIVALGREGKARCRLMPRRPRTVAMQEKLTSEAGQTAYRKRKWIAEPPNGWIKAVLGFRQFQPARPWRRCAASSLVSGAQSASNGNDANGLSKTHPLIALSAAASHQQTPSARDASPSCKKIAPPSTAATTMPLNANAPIAETFCPQTPSFCFTALSLLLGTGDNDRVVDLHITVLGSMVAFAREVESGRRCVGIDVFEVRWPDCDCHPFWFSFLILGTSYARLQLSDPHQCCWCSNR